jgi:WD40 repeat protein
VTFSPDGKILATGREDKTVQLWDVATGEQKAVLKGHTEAVLSLAFIAEARILASVSADQTVRLWNLSPP